MSELLLEEGLPVKLLSEDELKNAFLNNALAGDIALVPFDENHFDFVADAKARGIQGPIIFISPEPTIERESLYLYNAIILDLKKTGVEEVRKIVNFVIKVAQNHITEGFKSMPPDIENEEAPEERHVDESLNVKDALDYCLREGIPVVVTFRMVKDEESFTVRGICNIETMEGNTLVLHQFKPPELIRGVKKGLQIGAVISYKSRTYEMVLNTQRVEADKVYTSIPEKMALERRKHVRVEPSREMPVSLFMLMENEPTVLLKVTNISQQGIGFLSNRNLQVGDVYGFTIVLPEAVVLSYGIIKFKKQQGSAFRYGVKLMVHPWDEEKIVRYIMKRELEIREWLKE